MKNEELIDAWKVRPYSWSQHSSFLYDPEQWYVNYILGNKGEPNPAMEFGSRVGDSLGTEGTLVPGFPFLPHKEYMVKAHFDGVEMVGYFDFYDDDIPMVQENKTSANAERWTQESVDAHGQLDMYALLLMLPHVAGCRDGCSVCAKGHPRTHRKISPKDLQMKLYYIPVEENGFFHYRVAGDWKEFTTKRTMKDVLRFGAEVKKIRKEMEKYAYNKLFLS